MADLATIGISSLIIGIILIFITLRVSSRAKKLSSEFNNSTQQIKKS